MRKLSTLTFGALVGLSAAISAGLGGCTVNEISTPTPGADGGGPDGSLTNTDASSDAGAQGLDFKPSNVSLDGVDLSKVGDVVLNGPCQVETESKSVSCADSDAFAFTTITQPDASRIAVYVARSIRLETNAILDVRGTLPIVLVALDKMEILGTIHVNAESSYKSPGGYLSAGSNDKGGGPGGGGAGSESNAGGGASYCGVGGTGAAKSGGTAASGGATYGNPEISPLVGGSGGGAGSVGGGGTGGGAIQLVAGHAFTLAANGIVHAGGGGGNFGGAVGSQHAGGGGSGGSILIEAETATIAGILAANGGGGGSGDTSATGQDGLPDDTAAKGGQSSSGANGGGGSAGATLTGSPGIWVQDESAGGGGGGAGRIRVNTKSGAADITGKVSPSKGTTCLSEGALKY